MRDALAEARGCVRIVLKVRPLLQGDLLAASHSGVQLRMLAGAWAAARTASAAPAVAASHSSALAAPRGRELDAALSTMSLEALAVVLGWSPSALEAFRATLDRAASIPGFADRDGACAPQLAAVDIAPSVVSSGTSLDGGKQFVVAPAPLSLQDFGSAVLTAAKMMGTLPATDVFMDAIQQSLRRALQFSFDRVYGVGVGNSGKDDEEDLSAGEAALRWPSWSAFLVLSPALSFRDPTLAGCVHPRAQRNNCCLRCYRKWQEPHDSWVRRPALVMARCDSSNVGARDASCR